MFHENVRYNYNIIYVKMHFTTLFPDELLPLEISLFQCSFEDWKRADDKSTIIFTGSLQA